MSNVFSNYAFNQNDIDLSRLYYNAYDFNLYDNYNITYNGVPYSDIYDVNWLLNGNYRASLFTGYNLTADSNKVITGGVAEAYLELFWTGSRYLESWGVQGIAASAMSIYSSAKTASTIDDYLLIDHWLSGDDTFNLSNSDDTAYGHGGNDTMTGNGGNDYLDGGSGIDTSVFTVNSSNFTILKVNGQYLLTDTSGTNGSNTLVNIERLHFSDADYAIDTEGANSAGGIYRTYKAAFNRTPEKVGFGYWIDQADNGASAVQMAEEFVWSTEFQALYDVTTNDSYLTGNNIEAVVDLFYRNVLGRAPDQGGLTYYTSTIEDQRKTGGQVLAEIADSIENRANLLPVIENGMLYDLWLG